MSETRHDRDFHTPRELDEAKTIGVLAAQRKPRGHEWELHVDGTVCVYLMDDEDGCEHVRLTCVKCGSAVCIEGSWCFTTCPKSDGRP